MPENGAIVRGDILPFLTAEDAEDAEEYERNRKELQPQMNAEKRRSGMALRGLRFRAWRGWVWVAREPSRLMLLGSLDFAVLTYLSEPKGTVMLSLARPAPSKITPVRTWTSPPQPAWRPALHRECLEDFHPVLRATAFVAHMTLSGTRGVEAPMHSYACSRYRGCTNSASALRPSTRSAQRESLRVTIAHGID
jgi:hypothetical protein